MLKVGVAALAAAAMFLAVELPQSADAAQRVHRVAHRTHVVVRPAGYYYGVPGTYYPAPPFPFFLIPGPWWLPAHP